MFGTQSPRREGWIRETSIVMAALLLGLFAAQAAAGDRPVSRKMERQIDVMERIIDQVLIDSPNFLVHGRENARGLFLKEFGVLLTFEASLVHKGEDYSKIFRRFKDGFRIEKDEDGHSIIVIPDLDVDDEDDEEYDEEYDEEEDEKRSWRDREDAVQERLYKRGKAEFVDVLLDYGDTLTAVESGKWVAIVAFLRDSRYFSEHKISKLVLRAKIDDLRDYGSGKLSEEDMIKRIVEQEY